MAENDLAYQAVEKNGVIIAIWEMNGRKHIRTIDPRSEEGKRLLVGYKSGQGSNENAGNEAELQTAHS